MSESEAKDPEADVAYYQPKKPDVPEGQAPVVGDLYRGRIHGSVVEVTLSADGLVSFKGCGVPHIGGKNFSKTVFLDAYERIDPCEKDPEEDAVRSAGLYEKKRAAALAMIAAGVPFSIDDVEALAEGTRRTAFTAEGLISLGVGAATALVSPQFRPAYIAPVPPPPADALSPDLLARLREASRETGFSDAGIIESGIEYLRGLPEPKPYQLPEDLARELLSLSARVPDSVEKIIRWGMAYVCMLEGLDGQEAQRRAVSVRPMVEAQMPAPPDPPKDPSPSADGLRASIEAAGEFVPGSLEVTGEDAPGLLERIEVKALELAVGGILSNDPAPVLRRARAYASYLREQILGGGA